MRRPSARAVRLVAIAALAASCGDTTDTTPISLNFDRPIDMAFACYGGLRITGGGSSDPSQPVVTSAMPTTACDFRSQPFDSSQPPPVPPGQETLTGSATQLAAVQWYGFVLDSEPGTVSIVRWDTKPSSAFVGGDITGPLDADPLTPGTNGITVGDNPVAIATSKDGCYEVTANAGTCDMSALDVTSALTLTPPARVDRLQVTNNAGVPILAKPSAMVGEPPGGVIGQQCGASPTGSVFVAYPSCHLVAEVDLATGEIEQGISFASGTAQLVDGSVTCPAECTSPDGSAGPSGSVTPGIRPVALDIFDDTRVGTRRLAIGADNSPTLTIVNLDTTTSAPQSVAQIALEDDTLDHSLGITAVALSPQIGMGGSGGVITDTNSPGGQMQFIYGIATDGTIHVGEVLSVNKECDTQVDPRLVFSDTNVKQMSCFPVGDPTTPRRRVGATGPGIKLTGDAKPVSAAFFEGLSFEGDTRTPPNSTPTTMIGYFAAVTASSGATFFVNVDDDYYGDIVDPNAPFQTQVPLAIAHQLRDAIEDRNEVDLQPYTCDNAGPDPDGTSGITSDPRAPLPPTPTLPATGDVSTAKGGELPSIHEELCGSAGTTRQPVSDVEFSAPDRDTGVTYPDLFNVSLDETWSLIFEGTLSLDDVSHAIDGPIVRTGELSIENAGGMDLVDPTAPFCNAGVEPFDIVQLHGCDPSHGDADCPYGDTCFVHPDSTVAGLGACMDANEATRLADACKEYLISLRRYSVAKSTTGDLLLIPRRHDLFTTPIDGCTDDAQCQDLASYQLRLADSLNPVDDTTGSDTHTYACLADPSRKAIGGTGKSCTQTCKADADCDDGTVCDAGVCVEGVVPPQSCVNAPQRYDLRAGAAFTVVGSVSGYVHPIVADAHDNCVVDPAAHPFQIGRIPLTAPACDPTADPRTGLKPDGTYDANPCQATVGQAQFSQSFQANTCVETTGSAEVLQTTGIRFHGPGMTFTLVDATYPGDAACIGDGSGSLGSDVPMVPDGYELSFRVVGGFSPLVPSIDPSLPVKVVRGPTESLWVMDAGDFISTSLTEATTKGRVYRFESVSPVTVNVLE